MTDAATGTVERIFREESGRAVATLVRLFGDIDIAEEAVQEAFVVAAERWPDDGRAAEPRRLDHHHRPQPGHRPAPARVVPPRPLRAGRRCSSRHDEEIEVDPVSDDRLRLIFTCCHPALAPTPRSR